MDSTLYAYQDYLVKEKNYSLLTVQAYVADILSFQQYLQDHHGVVALDEVVYSQIRSWIVILIENNISNTSVNRKISSLKSFYKFLLKVKQIQVNPLLKHKSLKTSKKIQIPFSEKELNVKNGKIGMHLRGSSNEEMNGKVGMYLFGRRFN
jgi:integrase/recombinase XerC